MCKNFNLVISAGSIFIPQTSSVLLNLSGSAMFSPSSSLDFIQLEKKAQNILAETGWLDVPLLSEKLDIDAETSIKVMKNLKNKGIIIKQNAI